MARMLALTRRSQFLAVYDAGKAFSNRLVVIKILNNELPVTRLGLSVSKNIGNAVKRNRIRRLFKEITRVLEIKKGWDIVIIARRDAKEADYNSLNKSITRLMSRAGLLD